MSKRRIKGSARILRALSAATLGITCLNDPAWAQPGGTGANGTYFWTAESTFGTAWSDHLNWNLPLGLNSPFYPNGTGAVAIVTSAPTVTLDVDVTLADFSFANSLLTGTSKTITTNRIFVGNAANNIGTINGVTVSANGNIFVRGELKLGAGAILEAANNCSIDADATISLISGAGTFKWSGGSLASGSGSNTLVSSGNMLITGTAAKTLAFGTFTNSGTAVWDSGDLGTLVGPTWNNSGTFDVRSNNSFTRLGGSLVMTLNNTGTIKKTAGTGSSVIDANLVNTGTVQANSGYLLFNDDFLFSSSSGTFLSNAGTLQFNGNGFATGAFFGGSGASQLLSTNVVTGAATVGAGTLQVAGAVNSINGTLTLNSGGTFELVTGGELRGSGLIKKPVGTSGVFRFSGGTLSGDLGAATLTNSADMLITGADPKVLSIGKFNNAGSAIWNAGEIGTLIGPTFGNSGTFDIRSNNNISRLGGTLVMTLSNSGTLKKTAGTGTSSIDANLINTGTVQADTGYLRFNDDFHFSSSSGTFISNAGTLQFIGNGFATGADFRGSGYSQLLNDNTVTGSASVSSGTVQVIGITNAINGTLVIGSSSTFELATGGELRGTGLIKAADIIVAGPPAPHIILPPETFLFSGGTLTGDTGAGTLTNSAKMIIAGTDPKVLAHGKFHNAGSVSWTAGDLGTLVAPVLGNSGTFDAQSDNNISRLGGSFPLTLNNSGTFKKSAGTGTSSIETILNNSGTVLAGSGYLSFVDSFLISSNSGTFISNAGTLQFSGNGFATGTNFRGTGTSQLLIDNTVTGSINVASGTVQVVGINNKVNGTLSISAPGTFELATGGELQGNGLITGAGTFRFSGGTLTGDTGSGSLTNTGNMLITSAAAKTLANGHYINAGSAVWNGGDLGTLLAPVLDNSGTFDAQSDNNIARLGGSFPLTLNNSGTFKKTAGTGTSSIETVLHNSGTVLANSGYLQFNDSFLLSSSTGTFISNAGTLQFSGNTFGGGANFGGTGVSQWLLGNTVTGSVSLNLGGRVQVVGIGNAINGFLGLPSTSTFELATGGELHGNGTITGSITDAVGVFKFSGGTLSGDTSGVGTLVNFTNMQITGTDAKILSTGRFRAGGNTTWDSGDLGTLFGTTFQNSGVMTIIADNNISRLGGTAPMQLNNTGTMRKTAGTGSSTWEAIVNNTGTLLLNSGTVNYPFDFTTSGTFTLGASASISFTGAVTTLGGVQNWPANFSLPLINTSNLNTDTGPAGAKLLISQNGGTMNINSTQHFVSLTVNGAKAVVSAGGNKVVRTGSLDLVPLAFAGGQLDLNSGLIVDYTAGNSPFATIYQQIFTGYNSGTWNGTSSVSGAINSSSATAAAGGLHPTAVGYAEASRLGITSFFGESVDSTTVLARYTYAGDANLDGKVNALDFNAVATNYGIGGAKFWADGDFTFDNAVSNNDFTFVGQNFNQPVLGTAPPVLGALVPEPSTLGLLTVVAISSRRRRR